VDGVATDPTTNAATLAEASEVLAVSTAFAQRLLDQALFGPPRTDGRIARADVIAYERRRRARLGAVAAITKADLASGVAYH
jgi:hypothetical protein